MAKIGKCLLSSTSKTDDGAMVKIEVKRAPDIRAAKPAYKGERPSDFMIPEILSCLAMNIAIKMLEQIISRSLNRCFKVPFVSMLIYFIT